MSKFQEISNFIWGVADDVLRGTFKQHEYGDIILPFVVLRRLDCIVEPHKDKVIALYDELKNDVDPTPIIAKQTGLYFYNHSHYDLSRLTNDPNNLRNNLPNYLNSFSSNVEEIIANFQLNPHIDKLQKNNLLFLLISKFSEIDLHPNVVDNHTMGQIFEELLRRFSEISNETSGEHYTPRDVVKLLVALVFNNEEHNITGEGTIRSIYDPCCGTGGMLTIGKDWINENISDSVKLNLYGQELNGQTYAICKSDMLISGEDPNHIKQGSSLSKDHYEGRTFDYMITNPPFGVSWKKEKDFILEEKGNPLGRFSVGTPRTSDGSLLFLQHMISKMNPKGSRIGVVFNGSPLFTGDAGSGESEIRRWIIENDWLECVVALPDQLFFNTGISTYIWIVNNKKDKPRKGKVQLLDGSKLYKSMKKSLGSKRKYIDQEQAEEIKSNYTQFEETEISKIYDNEFFGYTKVPIEQPKIEEGEIVRDRKGNPKPDTSLRDHERIPLQDDIEMYFTKEVEPHLPSAWMDLDKSKVGYEINFTKYFYEYKPLRPSAKIVEELLDLEKETENLLKQILD